MKNNLKKGDFGIFPAQLCKGLPAFQQTIFNWIYFHTNIEGTCFPSLKTLAEESGMSKDSVIKSIKRLEERKLIKKKNRKKKGKQENDSNLYEVVAHSDHVVGYSDHPSRPQRPQVVAHTVSNHTQLNQTQLTKPNNIQKSDKSLLDISGNEINKLIEKFKPINPSYEILFQRKNQRDALARLVKKYTFEKVANMLSALPAIVTQKYAPQITTPIQLEEKLGSLLLFLKKEQIKKVGIEDLTTN